MDKIVCPHCHKTFEVTEALKHQVIEEALSEERIRHKEELEKAKEDLRKDAEKKLKEELEFKMKDSQNEIQEARNKSEKLQEDLLGMTKLIRELKDKDKERELQMERKIMEETEKIEEKVSKSIMEKADIEKAELEKKLKDTQKALEDAQRKASQKSQQLQGEVLELELENLLRASFPQDDIEPIGKGVSGADIRHVVKSPRGFVCGTILWESKRTKDWQDKWIPKLKEDLRVEKAVFSVIVSSELPKEAENGMGQKDGVWICAQSLVVPLASILRKNLLDVGYQKLVSANKGGKAELLYGYITGHEFQQQVENIIEVYAEMKTQIEKERAAFERAWKAREIQATRILNGTANIVGNMQGVVGASMPAIKGLELPELETGDVSMTDDR